MTLIPLIQTSLIQEKGCTNLQDSRNLSTELTELCYNCVYLDFLLEVRDVAPDLEHVAPAAVVADLGRGRGRIEQSGRRVLELVHGGAVGAAPLMPAGAEVPVVLVLQATGARALDDGGAEHPRPRAVRVLLTDLGSMYFSWCRENLLQYFLHLKTP